MWKSDEALPPPQSDPLNPFGSSSSELGSTVPSAHTSPVGPIVTISGTHTPPNRNPGPNTHVGTTATTNAGAPRAQSIPFMATGILPNLTKITNDPIKHYATWPHAYEVTFGHTKVRRKNWRGPIQ